MIADAADAPVLFDVWLQRWAEPKQCAVRLLLQRVVDTSVVHDRMFHNLLAETQFTAEEVDELLTILYALTEQAPSIEGICQRLRQFCKGTQSGHPRTLRGRQAQIGDVALGRVIPLRSYAQLLVDTGHHTDLPEAITALRAMFGAVPQDYPPDWQQYPLGRYAMWSTFSQAGGSPLGDERRSAIDLLEMLGLDPLHDGDLLLVFEYHLPADIIPRVPSFFDGYVGQGWNTWFRVAAHEAPFGRTRPIGGREARGAPEVIHHVIQASQLAAPLRYRP